MPETRFLITRIANGQVQELTWAVAVGREVDGVKLVKSGSSRKHAVLTYEDGSVYLEDSQSAGGTYVNSAKITRKVRLSSGDRLTFDEEEFLFRVEAGGDAARTAGLARRQKTPDAWADVEWETRLRDGTERLTRDQLNEHYRKSLERLAHLKTQRVSIPCLVPASGGAAAGRTQRIILLTVNDEAVQEWLIGRHADSTIRFGDKSVSECHAKIVREGQKWKLLDAITPNGCYVNDLQIGMAYLSSGDRVRFGTVECTFYLPTVQQQAGKRFVGSMAFWILVALAVLLAIAAGTVIFGGSVRGLRWLAENPLLY